jgi:hypothetical protein
MPIRIGLPLCADAPENETKSDDQRSAKKAQRAAAKFHHLFLP